MKWSTLRQNFKNPKKNSKTNFKVSIKKRNIISLYTHFQKFITIKKDHTNKKDIYFNSYDTLILYYIKKEQAINFVLEIF